MKTLLLQGVGRLDIPCSSDGVRLKSYIVWQDMLRRCYSNEYKTRRPTYADCTVSDDWLIFSHFKLWFDANYILGYSLDKDIRYPGNKHYSSDTCLFVPPELNTLLAPSPLNSRRLTGASFVRKLGKYSSTYRSYGKTVYLGVFDTAEQAHSAWVIAKRQHIMNVAASLLGSCRITQFVHDAVVSSCPVLVC